MFLSVSFMTIDLFFARIRFLNADFFFIRNVLTKFLLNHPFYNFVYFFTYSLTEHINFVILNICYEVRFEFKLKTNFVANIQYKEIDLFGWRVREKINEVTERVVKQKFGQNMSNKEKSALRNLIHAKNTSIVINDTDKNMGAADADKTDVISECE